MPLIINGIIVDKLPTNTASIFDLYPSCKEYVRTFLAQPSKTISPIGSLNILQREYGFITPNDPRISIIGSDCATTCSIVFLRHPGTGMISCGHFDGSDTERCIKEMLKKHLELAVRMKIQGGLELHLIGGYLDSNGYSKNLSMEILYHFHHQNVDIHLVTACFCEQNNTIRNSINLPMVCGAAANVKTGNIFPASFHDKGPDVFLRSSRLFARSSPEMMEIYDSTEGFIKVSPFTYEPVRGIELWLKSDDDLILKYLSTSPQAEDANFVPHTRQTLEFIKKNPFPSITIFPDGRPRCYRLDEYGQWSQINFDNNVFFGHNMPISNNFSYRAKPFTNQFKH